jgi:2-polyprenyl-3-methyl-5-hydroxy-6-metoxy-1,4-benzoquinol methylase
MPSFKLRSYQKELLDGNNIPFEDIKTNMQELEFINRHLGGHAITLEGIGYFANGQPLRVLEIGCGGGDNLAAIRHWANRSNQEVILTGVDINAECIAFAESQKNNEGIEFIQSDYRDLLVSEKPDVIFSSLFCHHFNYDELVVMLQWMFENSRLGFVINDLHRHPLAYYSIKMLTGLFSKSYLVKNDAPLSVLRGLTRSEWESVFAEAGITSFKCRWKWAFRWLITCSHDC